MQTYCPRNVDATKILVRRELAAVLVDLKRIAPGASFRVAPIGHFRLNVAMTPTACTKVPGSGPIASRKPSPDINIARCCMI